MSVCPQLRTASQFLVPLVVVNMALAARNGKGFQPYKADGIVRQSSVKGVREAHLPIIGARSHAANLLSLPNGDLLCFFFTGPEEGSSGVSIAMSRLNRGSNRWSRPIVLSHHPGWSDQNPVPFRAPNGVLWLFHTSQRANQGQTTAIVYELTSTDDGYTWIHPKLLFSKPGTFIRQRLLVFQGKWLFPTYLSASPDITTNAQHDVSIVKISADEGKTWTNCPVPASGGLVQMNIVKLTQNRLIAFFRSRYADWIYKSASDDGCHWSAPVPTQLPNNNASMQAIRLRDGHLVLAFNNAQATNTRSTPRVAARNVLSVALSTDGGKTWPCVRDVENDTEIPGDQDNRNSEYSYPSAAQALDGSIQMAFTFNRLTIKYVSFAEDWIKNGGTKGLFAGDPDRNDKSNASVAR